MKPGLVLMAAGRGVRFGGNKLLYRVDGVPMARRVIDAMPKDAFSRIVMIAGNAETAALADGTPAEAIICPEARLDTAITIRLGVEATSADASGCMFAVCDQPYLTRESVLRLTEAFGETPDKICALSWMGRRGNPVIFPSSLFSELAALPENETGRYVILRHMELLRLVPADSALELTDVDTLGDASDCFTREK